MTAVPCRRPSAGARLRRRNRGVTDVNARYAVQAGARRHRAGDDAKNAADAHKQVSAVLEADGRLTNLGVSCFLIGSYGRDVSIKRVKDVDVLRG